MGIITTPGYYERTPAPDKPEWQYIADEGEREQCGHVGRMAFLGLDGQWKTPKVRCKHEGKFRRGDEWRCGYHTPGVGRKGARRVSDFIKMKGQV